MNGRRLQGSLRIAQDLLALTSLHAEFRQHWPGDLRVGGAQIAEVSVDPETGFVTVERVVAAHDVGCAINPRIVEGQVDGHIFSGMSQVLYEETLLEDGQIMNPYRLDYKMPRS